MRNITGGRFAVTVGWRVALLVALTVGFPFVVADVLVPLSGCRGVGGACGAVALVAGVYLKPVIVLAFLILILWPPVRRMRTLGVSAVAGLVVVLLCLADWQFLMLVGTHWSVGFATGLFAAPPVFFGLALLTLLTLAIAATPRSADDGLLRRHGVLGQLAILLLVGSALYALVAVAADFAWRGLAGGGDAVAGIAMVRTALALRGLAPAVAAAAALPLLAIIVLELLRRIGGGPVLPVDRGVPGGASRFAAEGFGRRPGAA